MEGQVLAVNITEANTGKRRSVEEVHLEPGRGVVEDAHPGPNNGGISILSQSTYEQMREMGVDFYYGDFGENIRVDRMIVGRLPVGTQVQIGDAVVEVLENQDSLLSHYQTVRGYAGDMTLLPDKIQVQVVIAGKVSTGDKIQVLHESLS